MGARRDKATAEPEAPDLKAVAKDWSGHEEVSGSGSGYFTLLLVNQVYNTQFHGKEPEPWIVELQQRAARDALAGVAPRDPLEGMLAAQMVAVQGTMLDCLRRAQLPEQGFEARRVNLEMANKLGRTYASMLEILDRHRGKGRQVVRVEHVTVNAGGQAIVGAVSQEGGDGRGTDERSRAKALGHAPEPALRGADAGREPVPVAGGEGQ